VYVKKCIYAFKLTIRRFIVQRGFYIDRNIKINEIRYYFNLFSSKSLKRPSTFLNLLDLLLNIRPNFKY